MNKIVQGFVPLCAEKFQLELSHCCHILSQKAVTINEGGMKTIVVRESWLCVL